MRKLRAAVLGLLLLLLAIVITAPASLIDARLVEATHGQFHFVEAEGTLLQGNGVVVFPKGAYRQAVSWKVQRWASLISGQLKGSINMQSTSAADAPFALGANHIELRQLGLSLPADL